MRLLMLLSTCLGVTLADSYFPPDIKICSAKDPYLNECVKDSANKMVKYMANGIRKLNAIPMDPLNVSEMSLLKGNDMLPSLSFSIWNAYFTGWKNGFFTYVNVDPENKFAEVTYSIPNFFLNGLYEVDGRLANIPLTGNSDINVAYKNISFNFKMLGHLENRNGRNHLVVNLFGRKIEVSDCILDLKNLFNDYKISELTNKLLNANMRVAIEEVTPLFELMWGDMAQTLLQRILDVVPYDALFTDGN